MEQKRTVLTLKMDPKEIPFCKYEKDFTFIVNGKEYQTSRFIADILSPRIRKLHYIDETINSFSIYIQNLSDKFNFSDFLSLISFEPKSIDQENLQYFSRIFLELGNKQAYLDLFPNYKEEITITNVFEIIQSKKNYFNSFNNSIDSKQTELKIDYETMKPELDFIASHFFEIDIEKVKKLDLLFIENICKSDKLQLEDEDSLLRFIIDLYRDNQKATYLFECVDFVNLSDEEIEHFRQEFNLDDITSSIWNMIINRSMKKNKNNISRNYKRYKAHLCDFDKDHEFNGIFKYLTDKNNGGNIHDKGLIEVSTNSQLSGNHPKNLIDFSSKTHYEANKNNDVYVLFDFKKMKINLTKYSIRSYHQGPNNCHLKNWKIEVSDDGNEWTIVDQQSNCSALNGDRFVGTFDVKPSNFSRFVRLYQTGSLWGSGHIWLHDIEFYGYLKE